MTVTPKSVFISAPCHTMGERSFNASLAEYIERASVGAIRVFLPQRDCQSDDPEIASNCYKGNIKMCDLMLSVADGVDVDADVAWQSGFAYGLDKPVIAIRTDDRTSGNLRDKALPFTVSLYYSTEDKIIAVNSSQTQLFDRVYEACRRSLHIGKREQMQLCG